MPTTAEREAKRTLRESVATNRPQVAMAEETLRLLRDGDKLNQQFSQTDSAGEVPPVDRERGAMDSQKIINILGGIVFAFLGWWSNNIWQTVQSMQVQVTNLNVELARNYVPRVELQSNFDRIYSKLDAIEKQTKGR